MDADRQAQMQAAFTGRFGGQPEIWARAPGRVDLMGSHTDYNQGFVLTLAIDRDTCIAARSRPDGIVSVFSLNTGTGSAFRLDRIEHDQQYPWTDYVRGVAAVLQAEGYSLPGFDAVIHTTVPLASGLSSSAALEVAVARLFDRLANLNLDPVRLALLCQRAENGFVGMNCGILDQYTSSVSQPGCALLLDCRRLSSEPVSLPPKFQVVICDTRSKRELTGSEYPERRRQCEAGAARLAEFYPGVTALRDVSLEQFQAYESALPPETARRCRFILEENRRVLDLAHALPAGDQDAIASLCRLSFAGARDLYGLVTSEMEAMLASMLAAPGVIGARQAGAGFGGCMVAFVWRDQVAPFAAQVQQSYLAKTGIQPLVYAV